ncbi:lysophospholipid acyltransferase family protein [Evansella halocellulosilytica]|uniref:lysophospholipid acyltransferase family protein n=1 Tax=Evansella halocellulosilytica TaxID=2011013 RepID=UPI0015CBF202|nr:lysophospholipid acyltransferase family protein [Evansella halocellulosilytica]
MFYKLLKFIAKIIIPIKYKIKVFHENDQLPSGAFIVSSNHTSCLDPIVISLLLKRDIHFLAKAELFQNKLSNLFFKGLLAIPVDRRKGNRIKPVRSALRLLKKGEVVGIFPEGSRMKEGERVPPKNGVAFLGLKGDVPVLPVAISLSKKRKWFREEALIHFGTPIDISTVGLTHYSELAAYIFNQSLELLPGERRTVHINLNVESKKEMKQ